MENKAKSKKQLIQEQAQIARHCERMKTDSSRVTIREDDLCKYCGSKRFHTAPTLEGQEYWYPGSEKGSFHCTSESCDMKTMFMDNVKIHAKAEIMPDGQIKLTLIDEEPDDQIN